MAGDLKAGTSGWRPPNVFRSLQPVEMSISEIQPDESVLIPMLGANSEVLAAGLRGRGLRAETLPPVDAEALRVGRRLTSGKECIPACMNLGALIRRLKRAGESAGGSRAHGGRGAATLARGDG